MTDLEAPGSSISSILAHPHAADVAEVFAGPVPESAPASGPVDLDALAGALAPQEEPVSTAVDYSIQVAALQSELRARETDLAESRARNKLSNEIISRLETSLAGAENEREYWRRSYGVLRSGLTHAANVLLTTVKNAPSVDG